VLSRSNSAKPHVPGSSTAFGKVQHQGCSCFLCPPPNGPCATQLYRRCCCFCSSASNTAFAGDLSCCLACCCHLLLPCALLPAPSPAAASPLPLLRPLTCCLACCCGAHQDVHHHTAAWLRVPHLLVVIWRGTGGQGGGAGREGGGGGMSGVGCGRTRGKWFVTFTLLCDYLEVCASGGSVMGCTSIGWLGWRGCCVTTEHAVWWGVRPLEHTGHALAATPHGC
jgi:hypothetical protein